MGEFGGKWEIRIPPIFPCSFYGTTLYVGGACMTMCLSLCYTLETCQYSTVLTFLYQTSWQNSDKVTLAEVLKSVSLIPVNIRNLNDIGVYSRGAATSPKLGVSIFPSFLPPLFFYLSPCLPSSLYLPFFPFLGAPRLEDLL